MKPTLHQHSSVVRPQTRQTQDIPQTQAPTTHPVVVEGKLQQPIPVAQTSVQTSVGSQSVGTTNRSDLFQSSPKTAQFSSSPALLPTPTGAPAGKTTSPLAARMGLLVSANAANAAKQAQNTQHTQNAQNAQNAQNTGAPVNEPVHFLQGGNTIDAAEYLGKTGLHIDAAEVERLNAVVQKVAKRIGLDHPVKFALETDFQKFYNYTFIATVKPWERPDQPILIGPGLKATSVEHLTAFAPVIPGFEKVAADFLQLNEEERIEALLVHEFTELDAITSYSSNPHRTAVADSPDTDFKISPRARQHLRLYARLDQQMFG